METEFTPLHEEHVSLNALMAPFAGWGMPIHYGSILDEARHTNAVAFYSSLILGALLAGMMSLFSAPLVRLIGTSDATFAPTLEYFTIIAACCVLPMLQVSLAGLVRSEGATAKSMIGIIIGVLPGAGADMAGISRNASMPARCAANSSTSAADCSPARARCRRPRCSSRPR